MPSSPIIQWALRQREHMLEEYTQYLAAAYAKAEEATNGRMLNERGRQARIPSSLLFLGPGHHMRRRSYASEELREHMELHPLQTLATFEASWAEAHLPGRVTA